MESIRPKGTVEVKCERCLFYFWLDPLDPSLPDGPFICPTCSGGNYTEKYDDLAKSTSKK